MSATAEDDDVDDDLDDPPKPPPPAAMNNRDQDDGMELVVSTALGQVEVCDGIDDGTITKATAAGDIKARMTNNEGNCMMMAMNRME